MALSFIVQIFFSVYSFPIGRDWSGRASHRIPTQTTYQVYMVSVEVVVTMAPRQSNRKKQEKGPIDSYVSSLISTSSYYGSSYHFERCLTEPIFSSAVSGTVFAGLDALQGTRAFTPQSALSYSGFIYLYNILRCPMEAIHGRESLLHNALSAGTLGYIGVQSGRVGIPFVNYSMFYSYPNLTPPVVAFFVYGAMGAGFGALSGKTI